MTVVLSLLAVSQYSIAEDKNASERWRIVSTYLKATSGDTSALMAAMNSGEARMAAASFSSKTDGTFQELSDKSLIDPKLGVYQKFWKSSVKPELETSPFDKATVTTVGWFSSEIGKAAKGGGCTIVITTSTRGAFVQFAKAQDADMGRPYRQMPGVTTIIQELERAEYKFKTFRDGKQTGKTDIVACIESNRPVEVVIQE
ncbi:MAG: hypothetical protein WAO95_17625 [Burkholderiales bacterium]